MNEYIFFDGLDFLLYLSVYVSNDNRAELLCARSEVEVEWKKEKRLSSLSFSVM